ncbi:hypothetical protein DFH08DRAFT_894247 [Mycena albidolilacea]|uniref:Uncharacterized protein n=1 Tax=Mycena albidolilacea TaxID=1033008 RepID=A0AAD7EDP6_9AGAR|nr:hypothetical protein DFH08DRAFT_894247 [Mycena albidolilacea]
MLPKFIPFAVVVGAALSSNATPLEGRGHTVTVTQFLPAVTVFQCLPVSSSSSSSASASVSSFPLPINSITPGLTKLLRGLEELGGLVDIANSAIPVVQTVVNSLLVTAANLLKGFPGQITAQTNRVENELAKLVTKLTDVTAEIRKLNIVVTPIVRSTVSATYRNEIYNRAQAILKKLAELVTETNKLTPNINDCGSAKPNNLSTLRTVLLDLYHEISTLFPRLSDLCDTTENVQALAATYNSNFRSYPFVLF